ncbi:unnamed protein product [Paramecium primaurelia]|uniref:Palmitoyltransferase n=1 Tax=Paramecium primaurelia TaxID=5886 RepID=A0A8S1KCN4_PARPR|nr:unnamed protein product [Paramecium primaurelia]
MKIQSTEYRVPYYQVYKGNSKHCLEGRVVMGYSRMMFLFTFIYLNVISLLQLFRIDPDQRLFNTEIALILLTDLFMILTVFRDPGRIPRITSQFQKYSDCYLIPHKQRYGGEFLIVNENKVQELKFCDPCQIYKTRSTAHCRRCDNCVEGFDHHCLWLGQCIGQRNYCTFYLFICFLTITQIFCICVQIKHILQLSDMSRIEFIIYCIMTFGLFGFAIYLFLMHTYFILINKTTYEYLTTNRFVINHHMLYFYQGDGSLLPRRLIRFTQSIWQKLLKPNRILFQSLNSKIYYDVPSFIEQQKNQQKIQFIINDTLEKIILEDKTKTYQSELCSDKKMVINQDFLKGDSEQNSEQLNQLSHECSQRGEQKNLKIYEIKKLSHVNQKDRSIKQTQSGRNNQYDKLNKDFNEIQLIDKLD